ncbi:MAG: ribose-phosphate pyrophosphokinase [Fibrobacter sp.]|nr:ribose-phosphate pyrophosphokinase [Fibrobacter sp.]
MERILLTSNYSDNPFAIDMAQHLGIREEIADLVSLKTFANSEFCPRFISDPDDLENIGQKLKGQTVVICSTATQMYERNSLAMRNFILARAAKDNGAERVVLIEPDLFYSAQDRGPFRRGKLERDREVADLKRFDGQAFTGLLYAQLLKQAGVDSVITVHNHSVKVQNIFEEVFHEDFHNLIPNDIYAHYIRTSNFVQTGKDGDNLVLVAPDNGAMPFVNQVWQALQLPECKRIVMDKVRNGERNVSMTLSPNSDVDLDYLKGKDVIILDDMVRTGSTIVQCSEFLKQAEPNRVCFGVTHFHTSQEAREKLNSKYLDEIMTTSSLPDIINRDSQGRLRQKIVVLKISKWISRYILQLLNMDCSRFEKDFYSIDMSSKNPRWPPPSSL